MIIPSLNTIGFPDWTLEQVARFAHQHSVNLVEIRGLENSLDLLSLPDFADPRRLEQVIQLLQVLNVRILSLNLGFRFMDVGVDSEMLASIASYAKLAATLNTPYLRFFAGGDPSTAVGREALAEKAARVLEVIGPYQVTAIVETHDSLVQSEHVVEIVNKANSLSGTRLGVLWDVAHTINLGGEPWRYSLETLGEHIAYLHLKDGCKQPAGMDYTFLFDGCLPLRELLLALNQLPQQFIGSFEWEKLWHPELAPGDTAAVDFIGKIRSLS